MIILSWCLMAIIFITLGYLWMTEAQEKEEEEICQGTTKSEQDWRSFTEPSWRTIKILKEQ